MIGMGRSDKPTDIHTHTIYRHAAWWAELIEKLGLKDHAFLSGLGQLHRTSRSGSPPPIGSPECFAPTAPFSSYPSPSLMCPRVSIVRPIQSIQTRRSELLQTSRQTARRRVLSKMICLSFFYGWMKYALTGPELKASDNIRMDFGGIALTDDEARAYDAPFPEEIFMTGIRTLPSMGALIDRKRALSPGKPCSNSISRSSPFWNAG